MNTLSRKYDFNNKPQDSIEVYSGQIGTPVKKVLNIVTRKPNYVFNKLFIGDLQIPESIKVVDKEKLIYIDITTCAKGSQERTRYKKQILEDFMVKEYDLPYRIMFDPTQITDYTDFSKEEASIYFKLNTQVTKNDSPSVAREFEIKLSFEKAHSVPKIRFFLKPDFQSFEYYKAEDKVLIGEVQISSDAPCTYADSLERCEITAKLPDKNGVISLAESAFDIRESNPTMGGVGMVEFGEDGNSDLTKEFEDGKVILGEIRPQNTVTIPVYMDMESYGNPTSEKKENIIVYARHFKNGKPYDDSYPTEMTIFPDTAAVRLMSRLSWDGQVEDIYHGMHEEIPKQVQWIPADRGSYTCFTLQLGNHAQNNEGCIGIRNLQLNFQLAEDSPSKIIAGEERPLPAESNSSASNVDLNSIFRIDAELQGQKLVETEWKTNLSFPNELNSWIELAVRFKHQDIEEIDGDLATISCRISFEYSKNEFESMPAEEWAPFQADIQFNMEKNPGKHWLAVDFGTSASVAAFDDGGNMGFMDNISKMLLDLQEPLSQTVIREYGNDKYSQEQIEEFGSVFLSSTAVLVRNKILGTAPEYLNSIFRIAPHNDFLREHNKYRVPYLKALIGTETVPNFDEKFNDFTYYENGRRISYADAPIPTNKLLAIAYYSLIADFAQKTSRLNQPELKEKLNKLVMTIPNSFTPKHIHALRGLLEDPKNKLGHFRKNYTTFLSESDAVVIHYSKLWIHYNETREDIDSFKSGKEFILIYDMGAGTLDLTYACITRENGAPVEMEVVGRLGKSTAGNYMDFIIADVIFDLFRDTFEDEGYTKGYQHDTDALLGAEVKLFVRNFVKPKLAEGFETDLSERDEFKNAIGGSIFDDEAILTHTDILNHRIFKNAIKENTEEVFNNFFDLYRGSTDGTQIYSKGNFPIDTVVLSGRGAQLAGLRDKIIGELKDWSGNENIFIPPALKGDLLKSAVAQGAMQFALLYRDQKKTNVKIKNRNIQAKYGLIYQDGAGVWRFKELLNPTTRPTGNPVVKYGITIYPYDTDKYDADRTNDNKPNLIDLSHTAKPWFVQSFAKDTAADINKGRWEYISKIVSFDPDAIAGNRSSVAVRIQVDTNNEMTFYYGDGMIDDEEPLRIDMENSDSFRESMWPYLSIQ